MKRTVYNTMIGLMLVCGLAMTSTGAMAQGRRPAANNNAAAAGNRSVATAPRNNAATVTNNNNNASNRSTATTATPQVNRGTPTNVTPQVNRGTTTTEKRSTTGNTSTTVRNNNDRGHGKGNSTGTTTVINANSGNRSATGTGTTVRTNDNDNKNKNNDKVRPNPNGNNNSTVRPNTGSNNNRPNTGDSNRPSTGNGNRTNSGHSAVPTSRPNNRPKVKGHVVTGGGPKIDYSTYRYNSSWRPRYDDDRFFNSFRYNSWSWSNPIRPSVRPWRPTTMWVYRPIVTVNVNRYYGYPTIDGVLGLSWGTSFVNALNYLYYNGYYIDGFMDNIVYLTDVELLDYGWDDVMMQFDGNNNLDYVEFVYTSEDNDTSRFFVLYNELRRIYGDPVSSDGFMYSWYGGDGIGFVNLGFDRNYDYDYCYTVLAFGV